MNMDSTVRTTRAVCQSISIFMVTSGCPEICNPGPQAWDDLTLSEPSHITLIAPVDPENSISADTHFRHGQPNEMSCGIIVVHGRSLKRIPDPAPFNAQHVIQTTYSIET